MSDDAISTRSDEERGTDPLREVGKQLPYDRPDAARRDAVRSSLLIAASEGRPPGARNRWLLVGSGFAAGVLAAAAVAIIVLRSPASPRPPREAFANIESSSAAELQRSTVTTPTGTDELVRVRSGTVRLAVPAVRMGDHVRLQTGDAEVEGSGAYEVVVTADALASVTVATGTATVRIRGQKQAVFLAAGETWRATVITADLDIVPAKSELAADAALAAGTTTPTTATIVTTATPITATTATRTTAAPSTMTTATGTTATRTTGTTATRTTAPPPTATVTTPTNTAPRTIAAPTTATTATRTTVTQTKASTATRTTAPPPTATVTTPTNTAPRTIAAPTTATTATRKTSASPTSSAATRTTASPTTVPAPIKPDVTTAEPTAPRASITAIAEPAVPAVTGNSPTEKSFRAGYSLLRANKYTDAALELGKAAEGDGALAADARYFQAVALTKAGRGAEAERALVQFIDRAPTSVRRGRAIVMLARLLVARGEPTSARAWFEDALRDADPLVVAAARAGLAAVK